MAIYPVILAGGSGTRLWPLSRANHPKQFLDVLGGGASLFQESMRRAQACSDKPAIIVSNVDHRFILQHQLDALNIHANSILLEPSPKNTLGAIALACLDVLQTDSQASMLVLPADHYLPDDLAFSSAVHELFSKLAEQDIGLLGIRPSSAAQQFGYIQYQSSSEPNLMNVTAFIEKPDASKASDLLKMKHVAWNSGMLLGSAKAIYDLIKQFEPDALRVVEMAYGRASSKYGYRFIDRHYESLIPKSFDVAILEQSENLKLRILDQAWDDLGTWSSVLQTRNQLAKPNANVFTTGKTVLMFGADDMVLIEDDDVVLLASQDSLNDMSEITHYLKQHNLTDLLNRIDIHRPWGRFKVLAQAANFLVKQLIVNPMGQISLQSHAHRRENWVVVKGMAEVQLDDTSYQLGEGESISIQAHQKHRLRNSSEQPLEIIEVQSGACLDENDIIRYDDEYDRHK